MSPSRIIVRVTVESTSMKDALPKFLTLALTIVLWSTNSYSFGQEEDADLPNIIFILSDDHRWDAMGCAGNPIIETPELDQIAKTGVRFSHAFVTTPICAASRASFLSGQYERQHGYTFQQPPLQQSIIDESYPVLLREAGYRTGFVGKFGVKVPKKATEQMFDSFRPTGLPYLKQGRKHLTEHNTDLAIDFIRDQDSKKPFCLSLSFWAPHAEDSNPDQYVWQQDFDDLYKTDTIPDPSLNEPDFFQALPEFQKQSLNRIRWAWRFDTPQKHQRMVKGYYRMISGIDRGIGKIRKELERLEIADNTIIIYMGDNGYFLGERGFAGKWTMHDHSLRVPLIVYDPGISDERKGTVSHDLANNLDVPATILGYAGIDAPRSYQGVSLIGQVQEDRPIDREIIFAEHLWNHKDIPRTECVRTRRWKFIRYMDHPEFEELYDLDDDPDERNNLHQSTRHQEILVEMRRKCDEEVIRLETLRDSAK